MRRWAFGGLLAAALLVVVLAGGFLWAWNRYLAGIDADYFRGQGIGWAREFEDKLEGLMSRFLEERRHDEVAAWPEYLPPFLESELAVGFRSRPASRPAEIAVLRREGGALLARIGDGPAGGDTSPSGDLDPATGYRIDGHPEGDGLFRVTVSGPLEARSPLDGQLDFRCVLEFRSIARDLGRGRSYALTLALVYLAILYGLLVVVYRLGRREMRVSFAAAERDIRLRAIGSVAEGIAHEVRNPLNAISLNVQYLERVQDRSGQPPKPEDFQRVHMEVGRIKRVIDNFVSFARLRDIELTEWDLGGLAAEVLAEHEGLFAESAITANLSRSGDLMIVGDRPKLRQVVTSLLRNAYESVAAAAERRIQVGVEADRDRVRLAIRDSGPVPEGFDLDNMFEPYQTTRSSTIGLGLTLAKTVVESHGGSIVAAAAQGGGCAVLVDLPRRL